MVSLPKSTRGAITGLVAVTLGLVAAPVARAAPIFGSASVGATGATISGTNLADSTIITPADMFLGAGTGDLSSVAPFTPITGGTIDLSSLATYAFSSASLAFTAASGFVVHRREDFLDVLLLGTATYPGFDPTTASERISLTKTGVSVSVSATTAAPPSVGPTTPVPPVDVPEPAGAALLGAGLVGLVAVRRRKSG